MIAGRAFRLGALRPRQPLGCASARFPAQNGLLVSRLASRLPSRLPQQRRWETTTTGDDKSGHIAADEGEGILFFDNVFPLRLGALLGWRPWGAAAEGDADVSGLLRRFTSRSSATASAASVFDPVAQVKRALPAELQLTVTEIIPRLKDGGVFVKFRHPGGSAEEEAIEAALAKSMEARPVRPWFNPVWGRMRAGLVRGVPWLEDLASRVPSGRMRIEFCAPPPMVSPEDGGDATAATALGGDASGSASLELSQETIYSLFRRYGKIAEITSQASDSKTLPRFATIDFMRVRDAVMARSCLHGYVANGTTRLRLSYEPRVRAHHIWDWLTSHPRIVIPILAALLAAVTVAVFDPIRAFFIKAHVQHSFAVTDSRLYKWFQRRTNDVVQYVTASDGDDDNRRDTPTNRGLRALLSHRRDVLDALHTWLLETTETFIVVQGPRGSGKSELVVGQALHGRRDVLVVDCKPVVEAHGESATIGRLAGAVGYRPVFSWANNLSSLVDLAVQGTTGVKAGFSETLDEQLAKILQTTTTALREISLDDRHKSDADATLSDDAYLEAHPERRAVVVLDNFGQRNEDATGRVYDKLAEWAATLVQANIAHVLVLTQDTSYPKALLKALPDRVFRQVALGDLSPEVAKNYVLSHLAQSDETDEADEAEKADAQQQPNKTVSSTQSRHDAIRELDECIGTLGGRLTELESLVRRLKSGQTPKRAVSEMVEQSASEIIKMFLLSKTSGGGGGGGARAWTTEQAWYLVREMAARESLRYNEVLLADTFSSSADAVAALDALAAAELVTVRSAHGRPQTLRAGSPVYQAAFERLRKDAVLSARLDRSVLAQRAALEAQTIAKAEGELALLGSLPRQPAQTAERVSYLLGKLSGSQAKIAAYEAEMARLSKIMSEEV